MAANVQTGTVTLASGSASQTATITAVVMANTFVTMSYSSSDNRPNMGAVSIQLTNTTTITVQRDASTSAPEIIVRWYAVEDTTFTVQRGSALTDQVGLTTSVTLSTLVVANSFVIKTGRIVGGSFGSDDWSTALITTTTNMDLVYKGANAGAVIEWQVIETTNCTVQSGTVAFISTDASKTATVSAVSATTKCLLITDFESDNGTTADIGQKMIKGVVTNTTTLTFTRDNTGQAMTVSYQLVEWTDETTVQAISVPMTSAEISVSDTMTAITISRSFPFCAGYAHCGGSNTYSADDVPGVGMASLVFSSTTALSSIRALHGSVALDMIVQVVEFPAAGGGGGAQLRHPLDMKMRHFLGR